MNRILTLLAAITLGLTIPVFGAESIKDVITFEHDNETYKLVKIHAEDALTPKTPQQQEIVDFIRQVLDAPIDSDNLTGRKSSTDAFLKNAATTQDSMVVLYHKVNPIGIARITKLTELLQIDPDGKIFPLTTRQHLINHGYCLNEFYIIGGELALSYRRQGYMSKVASTCADQILKNFLNPQENPYFLVPIFNENIGMNKICQDILKCDLLSVTDMLSPEHNKQFNGYIYTSQLKK